MNATTRGVLHSSESVEWETPQNLFDRLDAKYHFTLDVCATAENAKCEDYYDLEMDGLKQVWAPNVCWMNFPYGRGAMPWAQKAVLERQKGALIVVLAPSRTDTAWFSEFFRGSSKVTFLRGRQKFGDHKDPAPFPSVLFEMRPGTGQRTVEILSTEEL